MKRKSRTPSPIENGFTIVELLIVIVVIAILAAITVTAYTGVQQRAEKAKTLATVRQMLDALALYKLNHGSYPTTATYCVGSGYVDRTGDGVPDCRWNSGTVSTDVTFSNALEEQAPGISRAGVTQRPVMSGSSGVVGIYFMNDALGRLDGRAQFDWLVYATPDKDCGRVVPQLTSTYPEFVSKADNSVTENWGSGGLCWIPLEQ